LVNIIPDSKNAGECPLDIRKPYDAKMAIPGECPRAEAFGTLMRFVVVDA